MKIHILLLAIPLLSTAVAAPKKPTTAAIPYLEEPTRRLIVYYPEDWKPTDKRPALVIFRCNIPHQREHFRKLGMVVIKPQTSTVNSGKLPSLSLEEIAKLPKPRNQVADCKSAIRYIRANAGKLGVDPEKIVATGTSGGGDLALLSHLNRTFENPGDDKTISPSPDALVLFSPAFDGLDIWFVKTSVILERTKKEAPTFLPLLPKFIKSTEGEYSQPLDHRSTLIELAGTVGKKENIDGTEITAFQEILGLFNKRDWQLLNPIEDAMQLSSSRILTKEPLPPTFILFGERDHLFKHQTAFIETAKAKGQKFEHKIYGDGAGHSFMTQPAFLDLCTRDVEIFLKKNSFLPQG